MQAMQDALAMQESATQPIDQSEMEIVFGNKNVTKQNLREKLLDQMAGYILNASRAFSLIVMHHRTAERAKRWDDALSIYAQQLALRGIRFTSIADQLSESRAKWMARFEEDQNADPAISPLKAAIAETLEKAGLDVAAEEWYRASLQRHPSYRLRSDELFDMDRLKPSKIASKAHKSLARVLEHLQQQQQQYQLPFASNSQRAQAEIRLHRSIAQKLLPEQYNTHRSPVNTRVYLISF
jgi:hypothetical protein